MNRNRMELKIIQAFVGDVGVGSRIFGLGENSRIYYWTNQGWKILKSGTIT